MSISFTKIGILSLLIALMFLAPGYTYAQEETGYEANETVEIAEFREEYYKGRIIDMTKDPVRDEFGFAQRLIKVQITSGEKSGEIVQVPVVSSGSPTEQEYSLGEKVVIVETRGPIGNQFFIADRYRLPSLMYILLAFFLLAVIFAGIKGFTSVLGLVFSIFVLGAFIVPQIATGSNPLLVSVIGAFIIAFISLYLAHGFNKRTTLALGSTLITLVIASLFAVITVSLTKLFGLGSEEAAFLQAGQFGNVDTRGLLLGGIIIGALGVLDDITTAQVATVDEILKANPKLKIKDLYRRSISVGKEHIASLVNTLVLAYAGASMPLFLLFTTSTQPHWVTVNSEFIAEEMVRTIVGSAALILAVPISTYIAAYYFTKK
jgi:uncharacterized membrane protein